MASGAAPGLGEFTARALAAEGARLVVSGNRRPLLLAAPGLYGPRERRPTRELRSAVRAAGLDGPCRFWRRRRLDRRLAIKRPGGFVRLADKVLRMRSTDSV